MSYTFDESVWTGGYYSVNGEGTEQAPIDFHDVFENIMGLKAGLYQTPQNYGAGTLANPYELCENNASEWSASGDAGSPTNESGTVKYNSYSIKTTKTGSGVFTLMWNQNRSYDNWLTASVDSFQLGPARVMKFSIYPSVNMNLDVIGILAGAAGVTYQNDHTNDGNGWVLTGGQWNDFEIELTEFDTPGVRFHGGIIHQIDFDFSGGTTSDTLIIDGLHFDRDDCDVKLYGGSIYEFCFNINFDNCYFQHDSEITLIFNAGSTRYGSEFVLRFNSNNQVDIGSDDDKFGVTVIYDCVSTDINALLTNCTGCDINIKNTRFMIKHWQWKHGQTYANPGELHISGSVNNVIYTNCLLDVGTVFVSDRIVLNDCDIFAKSYPIYGLNPNINGARFFYKPSANIWSDEGTLRDIKFFGWLNDGERVLFYNRQYKQTTDRTITIINAESDGVLTDARFAQVKYFDNEDQRTVDQIIVWGYTINMQVKDKDGVISGATVKLYNKNDTLVFEETSDVNGNITEQEIIIKQANYQPEGSSPQARQLYPWKVAGSNFDTEYAPFTLTVEKTGYQEYRDENLLIFEPHHYNLLLIAEIPPLPPIYYQDEVSGQISKSEISGDLEETEVAGQINKSQISGGISEKKVSGTIETIEVSGTINT